MSSRQIVGATHSLNRPTIFGIVLTARRFRSLNHALGNASPLQLGSTHLPVCQAGDCCVFTYVGSGDGSRAPSPEMGTSARMMSMGMGKMMVEFCSTPISVNVCR